MDFERLAQQASDEQAAEREQAVRANQAAERQKAERMEEADNIVRRAELIAQELQARQAPYDYEFVNRHPVPIRKGFRTKYKQEEEVLAAGWTDGLDVQQVEVTGPRLVFRAKGLLLSVYGKVLGICIDTPALTYGSELPQRAEWTGSNTCRVIEEFDPAGETCSSVSVLNDYDVINEMLTRVIAYHGLDRAMFR